MKNQILTGAVMLGIGFAAGWIARPVPVLPPVNVTAGQPVVVAPAASPGAKAVDAAEVPPGKRAARAMVVPPGDPKEIRKQAKEMQANMAKAMADRERKKHETLITRLTEKLDLSADQKAKVTAWLDDRMKALETINPEDPMSFMTITKPDAVPTEKGLMEALEPTLDASQKEALAAFRESDHQSKVDAAALKSLSKLQGVIQFEDGQRDEVYKILVANAEKKIDTESSRPDPAAMFTDGMGMDMDPYDLGITSMMTNITPDQVDLTKERDPADPMKFMREMIDKRIDERVEQLRPVLSEKQLELYRTELKTKGMGIYGTVLAPK